MATLSFLNGHLIFEFPSIFVVWLCYIENPYPKSLSDSVSDYLHSVFVLITMFLCTV